MKRSGMKPRGRKVSGCDYVASDEEYDKRQIQKQGKAMRTAGIAKEIKGAKKEQGYSKKPQVKGQKKNAKPVSGQKTVY